MLDKLRAYKVRFEELQQEIVKKKAIRNNNFFNHPSMIISFVEKRIMKKYGII